MNKNILSNNIYMIKLAWHISKKRVTLDFLISAMLMFKKYFINLIFIQVIVDFITTKNIKFLFTFIIISVFLFLGMDFLEIWYKNRFVPYSNTLFYEKLNNQLFEKASNIDLKCFEDSDFYNIYLLASKEADIRLISILENISGIIFSFITTVAIYVTMFHIDEFVILFALFPLFSVFIILKKINEVDYTITKEKAPFERLIEYTERVVRLREYAEEMRLFKIKNVIVTMLNNSTEKIVAIYKKYRIGQGIRSVFQLQFAFTFLYEGTVVYSAYRVLCEHSMSIGQFVVLATAMKTGVWTLYGLTFQISEIVKNGLFAENFIKFINYIPTIPESQKGEHITGNFDEIEFCNVGFHYTTGESVFESISLKIRKGEVIAVVGYNGVGKTTFTKLLTRLYDPSLGMILYNGKDIKEYNVKEYRDLFSVVSQDFKIFAMSIRDNILCGNNFSDEKINEALNAVGLLEKVNAMEFGLDTIMTKEFEENGVVFSGGELQKLAIARAYVQGFEVGIFDEPSSALDPVSEYKLFEEMMNICKGKTLIFISHRLSSTVFADRIVVFDKGTVAEVGNHKELYERRGLYYKMFKSQAERYINEEEIFHEYKK